MPLRRKKTRKVVRQPVFYSNILGGLPTIGFVFGQRRRSLKNVSLLRENKMVLFHPYGI
jgi:hypothetical protein